MDRPNVTVQVVAAQAGTHGGLLGAFIIAGFEGAPAIVYLKGAIEGQVTGQPELVRRATVIFNRLRAEALPRSASRDLIMKAADGDE